MAWEITGHGEGGDRSRVGLFFPHANKPLWSDNKERYNPVTLDHAWYTLDDDGELVYRGVCDQVAAELNCEAILDFSMNDCGATSLWIRQPGMQEYECIIG